MTLRLWWVLPSIVASLGCAPGTEPAQQQEASPPTVYVSNYPLKYFAERITSPVVEVKLPVPPDIDPAYWKPTAAEILALQQADLILLNGASYEAWLSNVSLPQSRLADTSGGLQQRLIPVDEKMTHSHGVEGEHAHTGTAFTTWMDLSLAVDQASAAKQVLVERWPEHREQFEAQFESLAADLIALDAKIGQTVASNPGLPVVFSHPVYQYFESRYGVNGRSVHWEPGTMPDEAQREAFQVLLQEFSPAWMIWEDEPDPQAVAWLETKGVQSARVLPCANQPQEGDFLEVWRQNLSELRQIYQP